ncbi:MAG TPA: alpha/beta hydrolase [Ktedonobacteraceae bacterium]|jgi:pimeloyl-ACP methyl ester carboxylesterase|nr:alpha/beta hydrolase [Ktedonobacteraceae bacterium]
MNTILIETTYKDVPVEQRERLLLFRSMHPRQQMNIAGTTWSYLLGGSGTETLLILPGGERIGDIGFPLFEHFEQGYRCLYPAYPPYPTMNELVDGLAALLDRLNIEKVILFGASFGGDVSQCFMRKYPERVSKLILLNTGVPDERLGKLTKLGKPLVTLLSMGMIRFLIEKPLSKALKVRAEEQAFWRAMLHELIGNLTRADLISSFDETIDYRLNYHFTPDDLTAWPGKILIVQSEDDPAIKPEMHLALRKLYPQAEVHILQEGGHTPFLSQPDAFYPIVDAFLQA